MEWTKIQVLIGTADYTSWLADEEQTATLPDGSEIGRASFVLLDDGTMPAISEWSSITLKGGGTAATVNLWAGYVTRQQSEPFSFTGGTKRLVTLDCQSAAIRLLTTAPVTKVYGGGEPALETITTDLDIVAHLVETYAPDLYNIAKIGTADQVQIDYIGFKDESLRSALNKISERTGRDFGVDAVPEFWYRKPDEAGYTLPYDYVLTDFEAIFNTGDPYLPMSVAPVYDRDATQLRNSVRVIGGSTLSTVQVETFAGNDVTTVFQVDYRPDVVISVEVGGIAQTVGIMFVDDPADFDCLVEYDRRQFHFDVAPPTGKDVVIQYRYQVRVDVTVTDAASIAAVGTIWAPVLEDASVSSASQGSALGSAYLASTGAVERATVTTRHGGTAGTVLPWEPGRLVTVTTEAFGWKDKQLRIRSVTMRAQPRPGGTGSGLIVWDLDLGSGPASAGRTFGAQWNNTEVRAQQYAPRYGNF